MKRQPMAFLAMTAAMLLSVGSALAEPIAQPAFQRLWDRTGIPIQRGVANYSWVWGPAANTPQLDEAFAEGQGGRRAVQYFDKSRMEINDPNADPNAQWYVTNGLLVNEMVQGEVQVGLHEFIRLAPATVAIAGDPDNPFPTYADLNQVINTPPSGVLGAHVTRSFLPEGFGEFPQYATNPATEIVKLDQGRGIPRAFWSYMNRRGTVYENGKLVKHQLVFDWLFTLGHPTSEAFWTTARIGGVEHNVMFQAFERRLLTYVPNNPEQYRVEMGNVGRHYYQWRYIDPFAQGAMAVITEPGNGVTVTSPLRVAGFENGQAFEAAVTVRLRQRTPNAILAEAHTTVQRPDIGIPGPFQATLTFTPTADRADGVVEVVTFSAKDGSETILASQPVVITR